MLKLIIVFGILCILNWLSGYFGFNNFLYNIALFFAVALLLIIVHALVTEIKIFQIFGLIWKKAGGKNGGRQYLKINYKNIKVSYSWRLNGGGIILAHEFVRVVSRKIGRVGHVFEYCSGPGFIGFSLLANNLCDKLTLSDINPKAIEAIKETIKNNNLQKKVTVYQSDCLDSISKDEQWDLVVSNPPWDLLPAKRQWYSFYRNKKNIIVCDPEGRVHEKFYRDVNKFLKPGGSIIFVESSEFTNVNCFNNMIGDNGLRVVESFKPVSFLGIFKSLGQYTGVRFTLAIFLRICLFARDVYFIWVKRDK